MDAAFFIGIAGMAFGILAGAWYIMDCGRRDEVSRQQHIQEIRLLINEHAKKWHDDFRGRK